MDCAANARQNIMDAVRRLERMANEAFNMIDSAEYKLEQQGPQAGEVCKADVPPGDVMSVLNRTVTRMESVLSGIQRLHNIIGNFEDTSCPKPMEPIRTERIPNGYR